MKRLIDYICENVKKWNKETCREEAKKYKSRNEFLKGSYQAWYVARKNGWLDTYDWFERPEVHNKKWNEETCREEAKKYKTRSEFNNGNKSAYQVALRNGWLDSYTWLKDERFDKYKDPVDCVYGYFFDELNAVYIGRTLMRRAKDRDQEHIFNERDAVAKFAKENDVPVPKMKVIEDNLTISQGAEREGYWEKYYREKGWTTLNRTKTGSIGGLGKGKWTKETCREEAEKYKTRGEFAKSSHGAYNVAWKNGWLDNYDWFEEIKKKANYWNEETCREEAKKYKTRNEFSKGNASAYKIARKNGWLDTYDWFERPEAHNKKWNEETCREEAKKYKTRSEFQKGNKSAYKVARTNGWLDTYDWFVDGNSIRINKWNEETCREEAKKYNTRNEFKKGNVSAYGVARTNGWLDTYDWFESPKTHKKKSLKEYLLNEIQPL